MTLAFFLLATHAEVLPDGRINVLGGDTCVFFGESIPLTIAEFHILAKVYFSPEERNSTLPIHFEMVDPNGDAIPITLFDGTCAPVQSQYEALPDHYGISFAYQQFVFYQFGLHRARLRIGANDFFTLPILVDKK